MGSVKIGKRERVEDVRTIWKKEPQFSDWLAGEDGLELIRQDVGVEIEDPRRECRPGDYPCDIVGNALGDEEHVVVVENQFGKTNHDHLGKLLTYSAVHKAMTGIWIAETVSDDHRQVIDWLNENTPPTVNLYLCELRAYRIGDSPVAPQLDVVCRPNVGAKLSRQQQSVSEQATRAWRQAFWQEIHARLSHAKPPFNLQKAGVEHWSTVSIGRSRFSMAMLLTPKNKSVGIEVNVSPEWKADAFEQLLAQKEAIEAELGHELHWMELPGKKTSRILLENGIDPRDDANRDAVKEWFALEAPRVYGAFKNRIAALQAPSGSEA